MFREPILKVIVFMVPCLALMVDSHAQSWRVGGNVLSAATAQPEDLCPSAFTSESDSKETNFSRFRLLGYFSPDYVYRTQLQQLPHSISSTRGPSQIEISLTSTPILRMIPRSGNVRQIELEYEGHLGFLQSVRQELESDGIFFLGRNFSDLKSSFSFALVQRLNPDGSVIGVDSLLRVDAIRQADKRILHRLSPWLLKDGLTKLEVEQQRKLLQRWLGITALATDKSNLIASPDEAPISIEQLRRVWAGAGR